MMGMHANKQWLHQAVTEPYRTNLLKSNGKAESEEVG